MLQDFVGDSMRHWLDEPHIQDLLRLCKKQGWTRMQPPLAKLLQQLFKGEKLKLAESLLAAMTALDSGSRSLIM